MQNFFSTCTVFLIESSKFSKPTFSCLKQLSCNGILEILTGVNAREILERPNELSQRALFFFSHLQVINNSSFFSSYSCFLSKIIQFYVIWYRRFKGPRLAIRREEMPGHILSYCFKRIILKRSFLHLRTAAEQIISRTCSQPGIES